jgi:hypothetical protein
MIFFFSSTSLLIKFYLYLFFRSWIFITFYIHLNKLHIFPVPCEQRRIKSATRFLLKHRLIIIIKIYQSAMKRQKCQKWECRISTCCHYKLGNIYHVSQCPPKASQPRKWCLWDSFFFSCFNSQSLESLQ